MYYYNISVIFGRYLLNSVNFRYFFMKILGSKKQMALYLHRFSWY